MIYITGDTHGDFDRIFDFCEEYCTTKDDILIILGDAGINYYLDERPSEIDGYEETQWHGGIVYVEPRYPNLIFAKDSEIYGLDGRKVIAIGGAYSVDKLYRISGGLHVL